MQPERPAVTPLLGGALLWLGSVRRPGGSPTRQPLVDPKGYGSPPHGNTRGGLQLSRVPAGLGVGVGVVAALLVSDVDDACSNVLLNGVGFDLVDPKALPEFMDALNFCPDEPP